MNPSRPRLRCSAVLLWARVLLLCLLGQSALGCADVHAALCADEVGGQHEEAGYTVPAADECDLACAHCHGGCVHGALALQRVEPWAVAGAAAPDVHGVPWRAGSTQHPLLRPPALQS